METYRISDIVPADDTKLSKGVYLVSLHATRIPPHIGILGDGRYHSLTVKGKDQNVSLQALLKNIRQRGLPALFMKLAPHPVFSDTYLSDHFMTNLSGFTRVEADKATCLSPVKLFLEENWNLDLHQIEFLYQLVPLLNQKKLVEGNYGLFMEPHLMHGGFLLPWYTMKEINEGIQEVRSAYHHK